MKIGTIAERFVEIEFCGNCDCQIEEGSGLCSYGCPYDGDLVRPKGMVIVRDYKRIDFLISEQTK
jgi:hypothetical protein